MKGGALCASLPPKSPKELGKKEGSMRLIINIKHREKGELYASHYSLFLREKGELYAPHSLLLFGRKVGSLRRGSFSPKVGVPRVR